MNSRAVSAGHKLGQMIGNFFEEFFSDTFEEFAIERNLFCDRKGPRPVVRGDKLKVTWLDSDGNPHDLDYVLEVDGSDTQQGKPIAFIELAWRRYTKHSRNKSGEIEGSLLHLRDTYKSCRFIGALLAGEYSEGGLRQLRSHQIAVLHVPFGKIAEAFRARGVDLAYPENASDRLKRRVIAKWESLRPEDLRVIKRALRASIKDDLTDFMKALEVAISRAVESVRILSLYGKEILCQTIAEGIELLSRYEVSTSGRLKHYKFEVYVRFKNGSKVEGTSVEKNEAVEFLELFS
jgi:hypothetical protein